MDWETGTKRGGEELQLSEGGQLAEQLEKPEEKRFS
jgi:hypothetical protein